MSMSEIEGNWDIVITSLQDICNSNESLTFDNIYGKYAKGGLDENLSEDELLKLKEEIVDHKSNIGTAKRLIDTSQENLRTLIEQLQKRAEKDASVAAAAASKSPSIKKAVAGKGNKKGSTPTASSAASQAKDNKKSNSKKVGRSYYTSKYNPSEPIYIGSEVAYKLKNRHSEEWIQCEVMKVIGDGIKFEIRDPEPDENNNPGQTFKANYKEILLIPPIPEVKDLVNYAYGTKVLARYPETTTFYPALVVGNRKDGNVRLKFDGEEEVNKETEVERRLVLPFPER
ncbi:SGF29 tudor-like domain-containing protein [Scheffersomyces xylosifermentans]|uniref:SGF29 tudor-like domain-containing protein n=1 Tax=Scheffersomyces xylosifermentans TaxID=1304137 RepID=UPI00315CC724